jgi:hypothetical protein
MNFHRKREARTWALIKERKLKQDELPHEKKCSDRTWSHTKEENSDNMSLNKPRKALTKQTFTKDNMSYSRKEIYYLKINSLRLWQQSKRIHKSIYTNYRNTVVSNHFHFVKLLLFSSARSRDFDGIYSTRLPVSMYTTRTSIDMCRFNVWSSA